MTGELIFHPTSGGLIVEQPFAADQWWMRMADGRLAVRSRHAHRIVLAPVPMAEMGYKWSGKVRLGRLPMPSGRPEPMRITTALDLGGMEGPEVDEALGVEGRDLLGEPYDAGVVDAWEAGTAVPTQDDVRRLATLTYLPVPWFFDGPVPDMSGEFLCGPWDADATWRPPTGKNTDDGTKGQQP